MAYSCAYFTDENNPLAVAEENKLKLVAKKLDIKETDTVLDIGCGWGSFLFYAAENYGCTTVGITLSSEQAKFINDVAAQKGLSDKVMADVIHVYDMNYPARYFDKVVTIGAIEHMDDLACAFGKCAGAIKDDGLLLVHGMTKPWAEREQELAGVTSEVSELVKEHFGAGYWKSTWEVMRDLEYAGFEILDHENITRHYQLTCERWLENLQNNEETLAGVVLPEDKYREFIIMMAGYIVGFETGYTLCNQILCRLNNAGDLRPALPLTRERMTL
jgi:cyclopropane-fatty-acyl-phospholipid synthase